MNVESQWDGMVGGKPLFPGTGHGDELEYVFGLTKDWRYPYYNNYLNPLDWEHDVTLFCERPGIQIDVFLDISTRPRTGLWSIVRGDSMIFSFFASH